MRKALVITPLLLAAVQANAADNLNSVAALTQAQFRALSEDVAAAISYKAVAPVESMGILGFDIGAEASLTKLDDKNAFDAACGGCGAKQIVIPKLHLHKGLPFGVDVGVSTASAQGSNIKVNAAEVRYALIEGGVVAPAVALRATYSVLSGVNQFDMNVKGLEIGISKGFAMVTPYAGVGQNWVSSKSGSMKEDFTQTKSFLGVNVNLGLLNLAMETDTTGKANTTSLKIGFRF